MLVLLVGSSWCLSKMKHNMAFTMAKTSDACYLASYATMPANQSNLTVSGLLEVVFHAQRYFLWTVVLIRMLHVFLQRAVRLLPVTVRVYGGDLLPGYVVRKRKRLGVFVLKEALEVALGQPGGVLLGERFELLTLFLLVHFPEYELQVADLRAAVFVAHANQSGHSPAHDQDPAEDLGKR